MCGRTQMMLIQTNIRRTVINGAPGGSLEGTREGISGDRIQGLCSGAIDRARSRNGSVRCSEHVAEREGIHERIQSEMRNEEKEKVSWAVKMLELPPGWKEVQDLILDDGDTLPEDLRPEKRKRD